MCVLRHQPGSALIWGVCLNQRDQPGARRSWAMSAVSLRTSPSVSSQPHAYTPRVSKGLPGLVMASGPWDTRGAAEMLSGCYPHATLGQGASRVSSRRSATCPRARGVSGARSATWAASAGGGMRRPLRDRSGGARKNAWMGPLRHGGVGSGRVALRTRLTSSRPPRRTPHPFDVAARAPRRAPRPPDAVARAPRRTPRPFDVEQAAASHSAPV